jgi:hypothetical protein
LAYPPNPLARALRAPPLTLDERVAEGAHAARAAG